MIFVFYNERNNIINMNNGKKVPKFGILVLSAMVVLSMIGCSKESDKKADIDSIIPIVDEDRTTDVTPTITPELTSSPIREITGNPTPMPDIQSEFVKKNYESYGRNNVFLMNLDLFAGNYDILDCRFAGDYALFWLIIDENGEQTDDYLVLTKPTVSKERYRIKLDHNIMNYTVLEDGTVYVSYWDEPLVHVYNDTLTEIRSFMPNKDGNAAVVGFTKDGTTWAVDETNCKLLAVDAIGMLLEEFSFDTKLRVTQLVREDNGKACFEAVLKDDSGEYSFIYVFSDCGEIEYRPFFDPNLGEEWDDKVYLIHGSEITKADYTWLLNPPGYADEMVAFSKCKINEDVIFLQDNYLCSCKSMQVDTFSCVQEFRLYDMKGLKVSEPLKESDFPDDIYLAPKGIVGDDIVVCYAYREKYGSEVLLWVTDENTSDIIGYCEFASGNPSEVLKEQLTELKDNKGIVITPDKDEHKKESALLGNVLDTLDLANTFRSGTLSDPDILISKSGGYIQPENMRNNDGANHTFNPHVFSKCYLEEHGEEFKKAFFNYVDALRAGEEGFECPDPDAAGWCSGRFCVYFYPVASDSTYCEYVGNGWAKITYLIPKEEFMERVRDFEQSICDIINDAIEDDYSDLEKMLALYEFLTEYCTYDYYAAAGEDLDLMNKESGYRVLMDKQGICWEISCLYDYLLFQCGIDVDESSGRPVDIYSGEPHQWSFVNLDGQGYLIDVTWGLTADKKPDLKYFLFTDELRVTRDGFSRDSLSIADYGNNDSIKDAYPYHADDDRYSGLWEGKYIAFDENEKCIFYLDENDVIHRFNY